MPIPSPDALTTQLARLIEAMRAHLIERDAPVRLALLAALAGEHLLLIGPPGTAKSEIARRLQHCFSGGRYFERLLTRFSVPEELFGPLSISALEQDRYERQTEGFLPSATVAFIDEVFKANSAILNALLTLLNEREFDNGSQRVRTPLVSVIGATNEVPDDEALAAFHDRFLLRCPVEPISDDAFTALLRLPRDIDPGIDPAWRLDTAWLRPLQQASEAVEIPVPVANALRELRDWLPGAGIAVSDRRWRKIAQLLRMSACSHGRRLVDEFDLLLTRFCVGSTIAHVHAVSAWFAARLGIDAAHRPERFEQLLAAFEGQLQTEQTATELNYDDSGKLILEQGSSDRFGSGAARFTMSEFMKPRLYGEVHVQARLAQVDDLQHQIDAGLERVNDMQAAMAATVRTHLWVDDAFRAQAQAALDGTAQGLQRLQERLSILRTGFANLPRHPDGDDGMPLPMGLDTAA